MVVLTQTQPLLAGRPDTPIDFEKLYRSSIEHKLGSSSGINTDVCLCNKYILKFSLHPITTRSHCNRGGSIRWQIYTRETGGCDWHGAQVLFTNMYNLAKRFKIKHGTNKVGLKGESRSRNSNKLVGLESPKLILILQLEVIPAYTGW